MLVAIRRHHGISPHTVVTADIAELRAGADRPPAGTHPAVTRIGHLPGGAEEYPQAIANDYPGWGVGYEAGQWTAWCPAMTVHAATSAGLRAAIEQAITGDGSCE